MDFLSKELGTLPMMYQQMVLKELEKLIRQARVLSSTSGDYKLAYVNICAKMGSLLESATALKKLLDADAE